MMHSIFVFALMIPAFAQAQEAQPCAPGDHLCIMEEIQQIVPSIDNQSWQDKAYRELAKSYTAAGHEDKALLLIEKVQNSDTKAMTIRGIGFAAADAHWEDKARYDALFAALAKHAAKIEHEASQGIAWTYIAMAQALAGDDEGASKTARAMTNDALRHKAFGENAEIQAERGDVKTAMASIAEIESEAFRNKAYRIVSKILMDRGNEAGAYESARAITNSYARAQALQYIVGDERENNSEKE